MKALTELFEVTIECSKPDWDGLGAEPVDLMAVYIAKQFICALPSEFPAPEVCVDPDGSISLDWSKSKKQLVSVGVGSRSRLAYAFVNGPNFGKGVEHFDGYTIPAPILLAVQQVFLDP